MTKRRVGQRLKMTNFWRNRQNENPFLVYSFESHFMRELNEASAKGLIARFLKYVRERNQQLLLTIMTSWSSNYE